MSHPALDAEGRPWTIQGWLLHYVQLAHMTHPEVVNCWGSAIEIMSTNRLPGGPISLVSFGHPSQPERS